MARVAALVLHYAREIEEIHGRSVGVNFDLKSPPLPCPYVGAVAEAQIRELATERQDVAGEGAAEVGGVVAPEFAVQFALCLADTSAVADH